MKASSRYLLAAGVGLFVAAPDAATATEAAHPSALGSLRDVGSIQSLHLPLPGALPVPVVPPIVPAARAQLPAASLVPGMPRDGGTNLDGMLRDPRATRVTPAGVRMADPGWMRKAPGKRP